MSAAKSCDNCLHAQAHEYRYCVIRCTAPVPRWVHHDGIENDIQPMYFAQIAACCALYSPRPVKPEEMR